MSRYTGPKARICRREGVNIFGSEKYQKILQNRPGTPGQHGLNLRRKNTQYGRQLREKQKTRFMFGITEKQMRNYYSYISNQVRNQGLQRSDTAIRSLICNLLFPGISDCMPCCNIALLRRDNYENSFH